MAGLRHPDGKEKQHQVLGQKSGESLHGIALLTTQPLPLSPAEEGFEPPVPVRYNLTKEPSPTAPNTHSCFRLGQRTPGQLARPYQLRSSPCLAAALRESNPRPHHGWSEGRPGYGTHPETCFNRLIPQIQGKKRPAYQPWPKPRRGSRTRGKLSKKLSVHQRSNAHLRHLNWADSAGLERATGVAPSRPATAPSG